MIDDEDLKDFCLEYEIEDISEYEIRCLECGEYDIPLHDDRPFVCSECMKSFV